MSQPGVKKRGRPTTYRDVLSCADARAMVRSARTMLRKAGANNAANYLARALKSIEGAHNNARMQFDRDRRRVRKTVPIEHLRELLGDAAGDLWQPHIEVSHEDSDNCWYWCDLGECPRDQWRGPFETERDAILHALDDYGVHVSAPTA